MNSGKVFDALGTGGLSVGFFFAFLPHAVHTATGLDREMNHIVHIQWGVTLVIFSLLLLVWNKKTRRHRAENI